MTKNQSHEWHEYDPEEGQRYFRASWDARLREWRLQTTLKSEPEWHAIDRPSVEIWEKLREILWCKYQRKRVPHKLLLTVDAILEDVREGKDPAAVRARPRS